MAANYHKSLKERRRRRPALDASCKLNELRIPEKSFEFAFHDLITKIPMDFWKGLLNLGFDRILSPLGTDDSK